MKLIETIGGKIREIGKRVWKDLIDFRVAWLVIGGYFLIGRRVFYSLCPVVVVTGFPCPGCGMTRAVFSILRGDFSAAWNLHPFSYPLMILALIFAWKRYIRGQDVRKLLIPVIVLLGLMLVFYVWRMLLFFPGDPPMSYYYGSILYRIRQMMSCLPIKKMV